MKKWVLRFREVDRNSYEDITEGRKAVETRAATTKYRPIKAGDILVIVCGKDRVEKPVKAVRHFVSIEDLFQEIELKKVIPEANTIEEAKAVYYSFPGYKQKIEDKGLLAFEL